MSDNRAVHLVSRGWLSDRPTTLCGFYWADQVRTSKHRHETTCKRCIKAKDAPKA